MFNRTKNDNFAFQQLDVEQIIDELQIEDEELVQVLVSMRRPPGDGLRERVKKITDTERAGSVDQGHATSRAHVLPFLQRLALRTGALIAVLLILASLLLATVPSVRAVFGRIMQQRFGLVLVEPTLGPEATPETQGDSQVQLEEKVIAPERFEEAQAQVPFAIPMPSILPGGFELWAARVGTGPHGESVDENGNRITSEPPIQVILHFKPGESSKSQYHPDATLGLDIMDQTDLQGGYAVPTGTEEEVEVGGNRAVFVRGSWVRLDDNKPPSPDNMTWDNTADVVLLSWESDLFTYILSGSHLSLTREDYIRIAESVKDQ